MVPVCRGMGPPVFQDDGARRQAVATAQRGASYRERRRSKFRSAPAPTLTGQSAVMAWRSPMRRGRSGAPTSTRMGLDFHLRRGGRRAVWIELRFETRPIRLALDDEIKRCVLEPVDSTLREQD